MLKYKQEKLLGKGGFGSAFLASRRDGTRVVIKEVRLQGMSRKEVDDAKKEAAFLASVRHPNIVAFIESFTENGKLCLVMEYADGGDLAGRIAALKKERKSMSEDEALTYFVQICLAVKHLHDRRIVHRDIKGANVRLSRAGVRLHAELIALQRAELPPEAVGAYAWSAGRYDYQLHWPVTQLPALSVIYPCRLLQIFLTRSGIVKLGDLGIARALASSMDLAKT